MKENDSDIYCLDLDDRQISSSPRPSGDEFCCQHPTMSTRIHSAPQENRSFTASGSPERKHYACCNCLENRCQASGSPVHIALYTHRISRSHHAKSCMHTDSNGSQAATTPSGSRNPNSQPSVRSEPDPEGQGDPDEIQILIDAGNLPQISADSSKIVFYRPNIFGRPQRLHCDILLDENDFQWNLARGLLGCWPEDFTRFYIRHLSVHPAIHRSDSHRNGQEIYIVDVGIDRSASFEQESTIILEIQIVISATWLTTTSRALYVPWRCTLWQLFSYVRYHDLCVNDRCYAQHNGNFVPLESLLIIHDGDLLQIQVHRTNTAPQLDGRHRLNRSNSDSDSCSESEPHHETKIATAAESDYTITTVVTYRTGTEQGQRKFVSYQLLGHDTLSVIHNHLVGYWHDVDAHPWRLQEVHPSYRASLWLRNWQRVNILEFDHDRSPEFITVMFEIIVQGPREVRSRKNFAVWVPQVVTQEFLTRIHAQPQSSDTRPHYRLTINDMPIDENDNGEIRLEPGAFIQLATDDPRQAINQIRQVEQQGHGGRRFQQDHEVYARNEKGCTLYRRMRHYSFGNKTRAKNVEGCTSSAFAHLYQALVFFLWLQNLGVGTIGLCKFVIFLVQRLLFLNYDQSKTTQAGELAWQTLRLICVGIGTFWLAIQPHRKRQRCLVVVNHTRRSRCIKPKQAICLSALWMCVMVANAHLIDVHQGICLASTDNSWTDTQTRLTPDDIVYDSVLDTYYYPVPQNENDLLILPPTHRWAGGLASQVLVENLCREYPAQAQIDTYGLRTSHLGNRFTRTHGAAFDEIVPLVANLWREYSHQEHMRLHLVQPQPVDVPPYTIVVIVEFPTFDVDHTRARPILLDTFQDGPFIDRRTGYLDFRAPVRGVFHIPALNGVCWPRGRDDCTVYANERFLGHDDILHVTYGDYVALHHTTFRTRWASLLGRFPRAEEFVRDFMWRSDHFNRQDFWIHVHLATGQHADRVHSRVMAWNRANCRNVQALIDVACETWASHGAGPQSRLITVWPQSMLQGDQSVIQVILSLPVHRDWIPVLISIYTHIGGQRPNRVETHAWTLPSSGTLHEYLALIGYSAFADTLASDLYVEYGRTRYRGLESTVNFQIGGHYVFHFLLPELGEFIADVARHMHNSAIESTPSADSEEEDVSMLQITLASDDCPTNNSSALMDKVSSQHAVPGALADQVVQPIPATIGQAMRQPRVLRLIPDWQPLCDLLLTRGIGTEEIQTYVTFGLRGIDMGKRLMRTTTTNQRAILQAVQDTWWDVIAGGSYQVYVVDPQPHDIPANTIALLIEMPIPEIDIDFHSPILFEAFVFEEHSADQDHVLRTDYIARHATAVDVYDEAFAVNHCQPLGAYKCVIEHKGITYIEETARFLVPSGSYIVLQISPPSWFMRDCSDYFTGASPFAHEALTLVTDQGDPTIFVRTHASNVQTHQFGHRSFMVHRRVFTDPSSMWHIVAEEWRDLIDPAQARLIYAPTPPQLEDEQTIRLIFIEQPAVGCLPVLVSFYLPPERSGAPPWLLGTIVLQLPTPTTAETLFTRTPGSIIDKISTANGHIWCEERYQTYDQPLELHPGTHILVYGQPLEVSTQEGVEEEEGDFTEDEFIMDSYSLRPYSRWFLPLSLVGWLYSGDFRRLATGGFLLLLLHTADHHVQLCTERSGPWMQPKEWYSGGCPHEGLRTSRHGLPDSFNQLPPPGNGAPTGLRSWIQVDLRTHILDCLDDFAVTENIITLTDYKSPMISCDIPLRFGPDSSDYLLAPWPENVVRPLDVSVPNLSELCMAFLEAAIPFDEDSLTGVDIYVDGSARRLEDGSPIAGYGVVLIGLHAEGYSPIGYICGEVVTEPSINSWLGATHHTAMDAERCSIVIAMLWSLQWNLCGGIPVAIYFDNQAAGYGASGSWRVDPQSIISLLSRDLAQACEEIYGNYITFGHIKSHTNHPGNDLADCIAGNVTLGALASCGNELNHKRLMEAITTDGAFCWLGMAASVGKNDLPDVNGPFTCHRAHPHGMGPEVRGFAPVIDQPTGVESILLNLCTVNVRSLFDDDIADRRTGRFTEKGKYLADQLAWQGYHCIGIQESCTKQAGISRIGSFLRCVGGSADQNHLGCELWIETRLHCERIMPHHLVILHSDPRRLLVRLQSGGLDLVLAVMHAPHLGHGGEEIEAWWHRSGTLCSAFQRLAPLCVLVDANAQTPDARPPILGDLLYGTSTSTTQAFLRFCHHCDLWLPHTYSDHHRGSTGTWRHPNGQWCRIDYICLPMIWRQALVTSWVDQDVDLNQSTHDHLAVGCQVQFQKAATTPPPKRGYDLRKLKDPDTKAVFRGRLMDIPPIPWTMDVHSHAAQIKQEIHDALSEVVPRRHRPIHNSYISDASWAHRTAKRHLLSSMQRIGTTLRLCWLFWSFRAWTRNEDLYTQYRPHLKWLFHWEGHSARLHREFQAMTKSLKQSLRNDRTSFINHCAEQCGSQPLHLAFQELQKLHVGAKIAQRSKRILPQFRTPNGALATSTIQISEAWRQHCQQLEAGEEVSRDQLLQWIYGSNTHRNWPSLQPSQIPSRTDLERHLRRMACGKAPGCDEVPSDICSLFPERISRLLYPVLLKTAFLQEEPVEYKGGRLIYAYKGKGSSEEPSNFRGLMLTSVLGKSIRSAFREKMLPIYRAFTGPSYFSARQYGHVGQAAMALRLFSRCGQLGGDSIAMAFLDVRSAYYRVCRELATGFGGTDQQICHILRHFDMPPSAVSDLFEFLRTYGGSMEAANADVFHHDLLLELSSGTWFVVDGLQQVTQTHGGSRPGDGLADMVFGYVFGRLIRMLKAELMEKHLWDARPWSLEGVKDWCFERPLPVAELPSNLDIIWADDLAIAIRDSNPAGVVVKIQAILDHLFTWCYRFGLEPNVAKGKSEVMFQLRGAGSRQVKTDLFDKDNPTITINPDNGKETQIHIVAAYKHLGGYHHVGCKMLKDIRVRCGMMHSTFHKYSKKVFLNKHIPLLRKGILLDSLIYSILRWNLGSWHELDGASMRRYHTGIMHLARRVCIGTFGVEQVWSWTDDQVLAKLKFPTPQESLHLARLSFFTTAYHTAPTSLWMLIAAERSWIGTVDAGVQWAHQQLCNSTPYPIFHDFFAAWLQGVQHRGRHWRGWIQRAKQHSVLQRVNRILIQDWHSNWYDQLLRYGFQLPKVQLETRDGLQPHEFVCGPCRQVFRTKAAWATHSRRKHGRIDPLRAFITDSLCKGCGSFYHTTRRLLAHLNYSATCARAHAAMSVATAPLPGRGSRHEDRGPDLPLPIRRPTVAYQFVADDEGDELLLRDDRFSRSLHETLNNVTTAQDGAQAIRDLILTSVVATDDVWNELAWASHSPNIQPHAADAIYTVTSNWSISWLFNNEEDTVQWPKGSFRCINHNELKASLFDGRPLQIVGPALEAPPKCLSEVFVIHFFSGLRRTGDIQSWISAAGNIGGVMITAISVDIIFDSDRGDLSRVDTQERWLTFLKRATVAGVYFGPPCNTWSVSRWRAVSCDDGGPRPIRTLQHPFGLLALRLRELKEVILGNSLLFFAILAALIQGLMARVSVIEHPEPRDKTKYPSIWYLPAFGALRRLPGFEEVTLFQGYFGAISPKPTRFGITGCESPEALLNEFRVTEILPPPLAMGRTSGEFSTAQLKEYPAGLSRGLAELSLQWIRHRYAEQEERSSMDETLRPLVTPFLVDCTDVFQRGADTRGTVDG